MMTSNIPINAMPTFKVLLRGRPGSGKTAFRTRLTDNVFYRNYQPSIGFINANVKTHNGEQAITLNLYDSASRETTEKTTQHIYKEVSAILVFLDSTASLEVNQEILDVEYEKAKIYSPNSQLFVICTKADLTSQIKTADDKARLMAEGKNAIFLCSISVIEGNKDAMHAITEIAIKLSSQKISPQDVFDDLVIIDSEGSDISLPDKVTDALIRCLKSTAKKLKSTNGKYDTNMNDDFNSQYANRSLQKFQAIFEAYGIAVPVGPVEFEEQIRGYRDHIHHFVKSCENENKLGEHIKSLLENEKIMQPRKRMSIKSSIQDELIACYQPWKIKEDKIERLVEVIASCLENCAKNCAAPKNRSLDDYTTKSRRKLLEIMSVYGIPRPANYSELESNIAHLLNTSWKPAIRQKASTCADLDAHIIELYRNDEITMDRSDRSSTLKKNLAALLPKGYRLDLGRRSNN